MAGLTGSPPHRTDPAGFDAVFEASRTQVVRTAFLIVGSHAVAEEIGQEAFLRLYEHFEDVTNPGGFLRTTVVRLCLSWQRRSALEAARIATASEPGPTGEPEIDGMWDALGTLRPDHRAAIVLRYYEDLSHAEIAEVLGCGVVTARSRVHRGLADLRKELER
ncbi:MAG: RNA polymerase sigma factor [Acidimicrobiia bacterium]